LVTAASQLPKMNGTALLSPFKMENHLTVISMETF
jgi:hypothetical protein